MKAATKFILIDDESINNLISTMAIEEVDGDAAIHSFYDPAKALDYIGSLTYQQGSAEDTILYLDINMPKMSGWQFLQHYENFNNKVKDHIKVYILSSSIDQRDKNRAALCADVVDFVEKPLTPEMVREHLQINTAGAIQLAMDCTGNCRRKQA